MFDNNPAIASLNEKQLIVFIWIYQQIIADTVITRSNKEIASRVNIPESTLEKYLKLFDDLKLIERKSERTWNPYLMNWETTSRSIKLNPKTFDPFIIARLRTAGIEALLEQLTVSDTTKAVIEQMRLKRMTPKETA